MWDPDSAAVKNHPLIVAQMSHMLELIVLLVEDQASSNIKK